MKLQFKAISVTLGLVALLGACTSVNSSTPSTETPAADTSIELEGAPEGVEEISPDSIRLETPDAEVSEDAEVTEFGTSEEETEGELEAFEEPLEDGEATELEASEETEGEIEAFEEPVEESAEIETPELEASEETEGEIEAFEEPVEESAEIETPELEATEESPELDSSELPAESDTESIVEPDAVGSEDSAESEAAENITPDVNVPDVDIDLNVDPAQ